MKIDILPIQSNEYDSAFDVLGKAFATQPSTIAIYKNNKDLVKEMTKVFRVMSEIMPGELFVAKLEGRIVGTMRIVKWPDCQMKPSQGMKMFRKMGSLSGLGSMFRAMKMRGTWAKRDPKKPHWHLDPLGVLPEMQGKGIGGKMMEFYCNRVDEDAIIAYHETDRPTNVSFYKKFGFKVVGTEKILDFNNWYLLREPVVTK